MSCEECDPCPVKDIEAVVDWSRVVMRDPVRMRSSPIDSSSESAYLAESVNEVVCCTGTSIRSLQIDVGRSL